MSAHTPGPWAWFPAKAGAVDPTVPHMKFVTGGDGQGLAHTPGLSEPIDTANANLIAAAPELLQALRRVETYLGDFCDQGVLDRDPAFALWNDVCAAIAKAEGR